MVTDILSDNRISGSIVIIPIRNFKILKLVFVNSIVFITGIHTGLKLYVSSSLSFFTKSSSDFIVFNISKIFKAVWR